MSEQQVVLATFADEAAADAAGQALKQWDKAEEYIRLDAIGVLVLDEKGKIKSHKLGRRSTGAGAGIGLVLAIIAPPTLLAGVLGGGVLGALHHKGLGLQADERDQIAAELGNGKAAVGVLVEDFNASNVTIKLTELGGSTEVFTLGDAELAEVDAVAPALEAAEGAAPGTS
jgi:uncharacterized membrane protein